MVLSIRLDTAGARVRLESVVRSRHAALKHERGGENVRKEYEENEWTGEREEWTPVRNECNAGKYCPLLCIAIDVSA